MREMPQLEFHDAANIFPLDEENIGDLSKDIRANGQQVSIELLDGKIIDGRRRYVACQKAGVTPKYRDIETDDPVAYVISLNLHRRHLTPSQRAMAAARARACYDKQAKERQKRRPGQSVPVNLPEQKGDARDQVGKQFGVSGKTVDHATKVIKNAVPEVIKAVDEGRMSASTAVILSAEPEDVQREEATKPKRNRTYQSVSSPLGNGEAEEVDEETEIKIKGVGVIRAHEAINCLTRIPKNDGLRKRGFQLVTDWIRHNK